MVMPIATVFHCGAGRDGGSGACASAADRAADLQRRNWCMEIIWLVSGHAPEFWGAVVQLCDLIPW